MFRLLGSGAVLRLSDFSVDSLRAVVRFAMVGQVGEVAPSLPTIHPPQWAVRGGYGKE